MNNHQPGSIKAITDIVKFGASADGRRRCEALESCQTLDDLCEKLKLEGFSISRSVTYLRLLPRWSTSTEGKRHVTTVPVRLIKLQNDLHSAHVDSKFCTASIRSLEILASILGPHHVSVIYQDDKAHVPLGITAASKSAAILMHLDYKVKFNRCNNENFAYKNLFFLDLIA